MSIRGLALTIIATAIVLSPAMASIHIGVGTEQHTNGSLVWIVWNYGYVSDQPCEFGKDYFTVGGVKWIFTSTGAIHISINKYEPYDFYKDNGSGFIFIVTPDLPCEFTITFVGLPKGHYIMIKNGSVMDLGNSYGKIVFRDYIMKPTNYTLKIVKFKGAPDIRPTVKPPTSKEEENKNINGFEAVFAVAGLVATAYLLNRKN